MQIETSAFAPIVNGAVMQAALNSVFGEPVASKPARVKRASKQAAPVEAPAKPVAAPSDTLETSRLARSVAATAVAAYYSGSSLPFKAASDKFAPLNHHNVKKPSPRTAALLAVMLAADTAGNIKRNGSFTRGGFVLPARLFNPKAAESDTVRCQPESGCLGNQLGRTVHFVSGATDGKAQADSVLRIDFKAARAELQQLSGALQRAALARIDALTGKRA